MTLYLGTGFTVGPCAAQTWPPRPASTSRPFVTTSGPSGAEPDCRVTVVQARAHGRRTATRRARTDPAGRSPSASWSRDPLRLGPCAGDQAFVSGHGALAANGSPAGPFGKLPSEVTLQEAQHSARLATLAVLVSLKAVLGDLDRVSAWLMVDGHVNAEPGFPQTAATMNPCSELIIDLYGTDTGSHARTAIGVASVPLNLPVVISADIEIAPRKP